MIFLTVAEASDPNRLDVWLQDQDHGDASRLGWIQLQPTGQIDDLRPPWRIRYPDKTWADVGAASAAEAVQFLHYWLSAEEAADGD